MGLLLLIFIGLMLKAWGVDFGTAALILFILALMIGGSSGRTR